MEILPKDNILLPCHGLVSLSFRGETNSGLAKCLLFSSAIACEQAFGREREKQKGL